MKSKKKRIKRESREYEKKGEERWIIEWRRRERERERRKGYTSAYRNRAFRVTLPSTRNNYSCRGRGKRDRKRSPESSDALALASGAPRRQVVVGSSTACDFA